jgi:endoglucanase
MLRLLVLALPASATASSGDEARLGELQDLRAAAAAAGPATHSATGHAEAAAAPPSPPPELIQNGDFENGTYGWAIKPAATPRGGELCVEVPAGFVGGSVATPYDFLLTKNDVYTLNFTAYASAAQALRVQTPDAPLDPNLDINALPLTTNLKPFSLTFSPANQAPEASLSFSFNGSAAAATTICLRDISLRRIDRVNGYRQDAGPAVKVNQLGFLPNGPKVATAVLARTQPTAALQEEAQDFSLLDSSGGTVYSGRTTPRGLDASSGQTVATLDFSNYTTPGNDYTLLVSGGTTPTMRSFPFAIAANVYDTLRQDAMQFFYQQRSGIAIDGGLVGKQYARAAGHIGLLPNQGDTAVPCQREADAITAYGEAWSCNYTLNATQGWYDAGDQGKYVVNGGIATAQLLMAAERRLHATDVRAPLHLHLSLSF